MSSHSVDSAATTFGSATPALPVDSRIVALMRCGLALSALAIIYLDPTEPARYVELTYASLSVYCGWTVAVYLMTSRGAEWTSRWPHWIDVGCATYLIALTEGTNSVFFFLFEFAILVAAFSRGYREGIAVTLASVALFTLAGFLSQVDPSEFELNRALIRPIYLLVLGGMMSFWGGRELALRDRLILLRDVGRDWNPRLGVDRAIGANLGRMVGFFRATCCLLVVQGGVQPPRWHSYLASREDPAGGHLPEEMDEASARMLVDLPIEGPVCYQRGRTAPGHERWDQLANLLDTDHFASVAYRQRDGTRGRLYVCTDRPCSSAGLDFLVQLTDAISRVVENTSLTEQLVVRAAEHERFRLSLDIHDTTVQPYIGLKLGLDAIRREAGAGNPLGPRIDDLLEMADATIHDLRGYASDLRENVPFSADALGGAIREQAARMERFYGMKVDVTVDPRLRIGAPLAAELFRIASEGLSNVLRHTAARSAFVRLTNEATGTRLSIGNEASAPVPPFIPRSISARAAALGGRSWVETLSKPYTIVHVEIPA